MCDISSAAPDEIYGMFGAAQQSLQHEAGVNDN
jgi:hypothetical protein